MIELKDELKLLYDPKESLSVLVELVETIRTAEQDVLTSGEKQSILIHLDNFIERFDSAFSKEIAADFEKTLSSVLGLTLFLDASQKN